MMAMMMGNLYNALRTAGAAEDDARKAAEEVAGYESRFAKLESDMTLVKWMLGFNLAVSCTALFKMFA